MALILRIENVTTLPDGGPVSITVSGRRNIDIGRDSHLDWTLPDPTRHISSKHCEIRYNEGGYWLHDVSTNGTFLNGGDHRMQAPHRLRTGDRFVIGHYIIGARVEGEEAAASPGAAALPVGTPNYQELWAADANVAPPIDRNLLKPKKELQAANRDFLDWAADIPDTTSPIPPSFGQPGRLPPADPNMDWASGPPSRQPPPPEPPPAAPTPRRPVWVAADARSRERHRPTRSRSALPRARECRRTSSRAAIRPSLPNYSAK
jgi:type VI secretion system protein ImpI